MDARKEDEGDEDVAGIRVHRSTLSLSSLMCQLLAQVACTPVWTNDCSVTSPGQETKGLS